MRKRRGKAWFWRTCAIVGASFAFAGGCSLYSEREFDGSRGNGAGGQMDGYLALPTQAAGAEAGGGGGSAADSSDDDQAGSDPAQPQDPPPATQPVCEQVSQQAEAALRSYCSSCHGPGSAGEGGFYTVLDVEAMVESGKIAPGEPDSSSLMERVSTGSMPPADIASRPNAGDVAAIREWIACGAPAWSKTVTNDFAFTSIDDRLRVVLDDLRAIANPVDREEQRYIDLASLANGGASRAEVQLYRDAVSFLVNSLSRGRSVVEPEPIDAQGLIYRIDLRDYVWDADLWREIEAIYPYAVIYDQESRLFPFDEATAEQIRDETASEIPVVQADWFLSHASRPPLYHDLLELPLTLAELEQQLGVDLQDDIDTEQVLRAGFLDAGPSRNNRVIERHELSGNVGAVWVSYDFESSAGDRNIFANPLDFQADGTGVVFSLDNGLNGYFIANAQGRRVDKASTAVLQDPASRDGAVENGLSCLSCHQEEGVLPRLDEVRSFALMTGANAQEIEDTLAIYGTPEQLDEAYAEDQARYRDAAQALEIVGLSNRSWHLLDNSHLGVLDIDRVASVLGIATADLKRAIDASPQAFPAEIVTLRTLGGGIQRDSFDAIFAELVAALGLGEPLRVTAGGSQGPPQGPPVQSMPGGQWSQPPAAFIADEEDFDRRLP